MKTATKIISGLATALALSSGAAACGSASKPPTQPPTNNASQACSEPAEVTAARIEKAISGALATSNGTWETSGGDIQGAYSQISFSVPGEPPPFNISLFTSPKLAASAATDYSNLGAWQANYITNCVVLSVANSATPAEIAAAQANHS